MPKADLNLTTFGNNPVASKIVPDIYDEQAVADFLSNIKIDELISLQSVFPDIPPDALTLGASKEFLGIDISSSAWADRLKKLGQGSTLLDTIKTIMSNMPPLAQADKLLSMFDLGSLRDGLVAIRKWLDPATWNKITEDFVSGVFGYVAELSEALGTSCSFCQSFCGTTANKYSDDNYPEGEIWKASFLLKDLEELFKCKLVDVAINAIDTFTGGIISDGTAGRVFSIATRIAAKWQYVDVVTDFIERAKGWFTEKDREKVLINLAEGYELDPTLNVAEWPQEAERIADSFTQVNPNWYYLWTEGGDRLTTKYLYRTSPDFVKMMAYHPEYWPVSVVEQSYDPLTKDWKEIAISDIPVLNFIK